MKRKADDCFASSLSRKKASSYFSHSETCDNACDIAHLVLTRGADGETPLHMAFQESYNDIVYFLLAEYTDVNVQDINEPNGLGRWTPLDLACIGRRIEKACLLILEGADHEMRDNDGKTAFEYLRRCSLDARYNAWYDEHVARAEVEQAVRDYMILRACVPILK